jgi:glycosyltransferase involved in cell wall biosynthesis
MKKKITIGLFNDSFYPMIDGVIQVVDNYAKRLTKYANVIVFAPASSDPNYDDSKLPYKVVRCKAVKMHIIDYYCPIPAFDKEFKKTLEQYKLDIVHIHSPFFIGWTGLNYAKKHNIPVIASMHSQFKQDFKRAVKAEFLANFFNKKIIKIFNQCDECWAVGTETARIFHEDYGYKTIPRVMENATDMTPIKDVKEARRYINEKHNLKDDEKVFLFVGRINLLKNIMLVAEAIKILKEKKTNYKFKMLFVGDGNDEKYLNNFIKDNKLEDTIIMCGRVSDRQILAKYFCRADLFVFPSVYDTSAIVRIEAASQSTPGVFLEGTATATTIKENVNGYITKDGADNLANKIDEIMNNKKLYNEVCKNALKDLYINWDDQIKEVYKLYLEMIEKKN